MTLHELVTQKAYGHYLEVGVCDGNSIIAALDGGRVTFAVGIDTWGGESGGFARGGPDVVVSRLGDRMSKVLLITGDSKVVLPSLRSQFDVILIDGDHSPYGALADLECALPLLAKYGTLLFDDLDNSAHPYLRKLAGDFAQRHNLRIAYHAVHLGVAEMARKQ